LLQWSSGYSSEADGRRPADISTVSFVDDIAACGAVADFGLTDTRVVRLAAIKP